MLSTRHLAASLNSPSWARMKAYFTGPPWPRTPPLFLGGGSCISEPALASTGRLPPGRPARRRRYRSADVAGPPGVQQALAVPQCPDSTRFTACCLNFGVNFRWDFRSFDCTEHLSGFHLKRGVHIIAARSIGEWPTFMAVEESSIV